MTDSQDIITPQIVSAAEGTTQNQSDALWKPLQPRGALGRNPTTTDLQSPIGFRFFIRRAPTVNYFVSRVNQPGISLPQAPLAINNVVLPFPGDKIQFEPLVLTFRVDEGMDNYYLIAEWMKALSGFDTEQLREMAANPEWSGYGIFSEVTVSILNAQKNAVRNVTYHNAWPTQLSTLQFDVSLTSVEYFSATAVFFYFSYDSTTDV